MEQLPDEIIGTDLAKYLSDRDLSQFQQTSKRNKKAISPSMHLRKVEHNTKSALIEKIRRKYQYGQNIFAMYRKKFPTKNFDALYKAALEQFLDENPFKWTLKKVMMDLMIKKDTGYLEYDANEMTLEIMLWQLTIPELEKMLEK